MATSDNIATLVDPLSIGREKDVASAAKEPASPARSIQLKSMISTPNKSKNKEVKEVLIVTPFHGCNVVP